MYLLFILIGINVPTFQVVEYTYQRDCELGKMAVETIGMQSNIKVSAICTYKGWR